MRPLVLTLSAAFLPPACGINEDNYREKYIKVVCELYYECEEGFTAYWDDVDACVDDILDDDTTDDDYADCAFDSKNARKCLDSFKAITCEQIDADEVEIDEEACDNIWEC
ncbi:MAG: hypothetical protein JRI25_21995 [Deltaproteobacteria bacterium]|nr:hypothetical protein [Deltaproteobacteria bacterium]MBW2257246.1 hypothetical protein [Deltaproteobacteria bacterium]